MHVQETKHKNRKTNVTMLQTSSRGHTIPCSTKWWMGPPIACTWEKPEQRHHGICLFMYRPCNVHTEGFRLRVRGVLLYKEQFATIVGTII